jgi:hypothetical protein
LTLSPSVKVSAPQRKKSYQQEGIALNVGKREAILSSYHSFFDLIVLQKSSTNAPVMAEFVRAQIFGTTFEITSRCALLDHNSFTRS